MQGTSPGGNWAELIGDAKTQYGNVIDIGTYWGGDFDRLSEGTQFRPSGKL
jgi:hypothetical protein